MKAKLAALEGCLLELEEAGIESAKLQQLRRHLREMTELLRREVHCPDIDRLPRHSGDSLVPRLSTHVLGDRERQPENA